MNRPIKFRACHLPTLKMFGMEDLICEEHLLDMLTMINEKSKEDFSQLMQFTGLYDCNGKEIYEDDIVEIKNHPFDRFIGINGMYTVGYSDRMEICCGSWLLHHALPYVTVVGNMYEHSHLLGGTEDE